MDDIERCAQKLGMRRREVTEVLPVDGGDLVRTHDGLWTLIRDDGLITRATADEAAMLRGFHGEPEPVELTHALEDVVDLAEYIAEEASTQKPAPKRRGRS